MLGLSARSVCHAQPVARELAMDDVFFSGGRGHDDLPLGLSCADVYVGPSCSTASRVGRHDRRTNCFSKRRRRF